MPLLFCFDTAEPALCYSEINLRNNFYPDLVYTKTVDSVDSAR